MSRITALVKDLPQLSTTSVSSSAPSTSTTSYTATVTPPSAADNPNIWNPDHKPDGTIFIAVGSIAGAVFVAIMLWWIVASYLSRKTAKHAFYENLEEQYGNHPHSQLCGNGIYDNDESKELFTSFRGNKNDNDEKTRKSRISLLGGSKLRDSNSWDSLPEMQPDWDGATHPERFNAIQDTIPRHYNRNSLFISPTIEVVQQRQEDHRSRMMEKSLHNNDLSATSLVSADNSNVDMNISLHKPERAASPERKQKKTPGGGYHKRNKSSLGLIPVISDHGSASCMNVDSSSTTTKKHNGHKKQTPSMYLNEMLEGTDIA